MGSEGGLARVEVRCGDCFYVQIGNILFGKFGQEGANQRVREINFLAEKWAEARVKRAVEEDRLKRVEMIRCKGPSDILVVEDWGTAADIAGKVKNFCHNHQILIRADYEAALKEAEDRVWEAAKESLRQMADQAGYADEAEILMNAALCLRARRAGGGK